MARTIIKKEITEYGTIELSFRRRDSDFTETMSFESEVQLKAFAYFLNQMCQIDASYVEIK